MAELEHIFYKEMSNLDLKASSDEESTRFLGQLFQWLIPLAVKNVCLISSLFVSLISASSH